MAIKTRRFVNKVKSCSCSMPGVWRAAAYCKGAAVIFHSPRACAHVARSMDITAHYYCISRDEKEPESPVPLLSSQLEQKHSIFGGTDRLLECIGFAVKTYRPKCIIIANSCMSGVIGDDIEAAGREAELRYNIPVITVTTAGFLDGEYYQGYIDTAKELINRFLKVQKQIPKTALLLGDNGGPWGHYAVEVKRLLSELGVSVTAQFPGYVPIERLHEITSAERTVVLGNRGQDNSGLEKLAEILKERFNMDYVSGVYPVSWEDTVLWIKSMGRLFGCEEKVGPLLKKEALSVDCAVKEFLPATCGKKIVVCIGRWLTFFNPAAVMASVKKLKLDLQAVTLLNVYDDKEKKRMLEVLKSCTSVPIYEDGEFLPSIGEMDLVLTTHELNNKQMKQVFLPMLPKVGAAGEISFMKGIYRSLCSRSRGGVFYV